MTAPPSAPGARSINPSPRPVVAIRPAGPEDRAYVLDSWARSEGRKRRRGERQREQLVDTQTVAVVASTAGTILAWCCYTPLPSAPILHYVYVRAGHRSAPGIDAGERVGPRFARLLLEHAGVRAGAAIVATSSSKPARAICEAKCLRWIAYDAAEVLR